MTKMEQSTFGLHTSELIAPQRAYDGCMNMCCDAFIVSDSIMHEMSPEIERQKPSTIKSFIVWLQNITEACLNVAQVC